MIEQLLPAGVVAVEAFDDAPGEPVFPGEEDLVANARMGSHPAAADSRSQVCDGVAKFADGTGNH
jgi:hypothetical protein